MYRSHFGLREPPFGITPDTSFAFSCASHQEALNTLLVAVTNEVYRIAGQVGTGKTLLSAPAPLWTRTSSAYPESYLSRRL
jgi:MSHA biogenesis protein MshM